MSNIDLHGMPVEELLILCVTVIDNKNTSLGPPIICALRKTASEDGGPSERVTAYFIQALAYRAGCILEDGRESESRVHGPHKAHEVKWTERKLNFNELTSLVEVTPYYRYDYVAANGA